MSARTFVVFAAVLAFIALLGYGVISKGGDALATGKPVPDKQLPYLDQPGTGRIADYRGRWVLVNFWASWCPPCRAESPALEAFYRANRKRRFVVLGINLDDATGDARAFIRRYGLSYPILRDGDGSERRDAFGMTGFPESFLVDPKGKLHLLRRGPVTEGYLHTYVEPLLPGS